MYTINLKNPIKSNYMNKFFFSSHNFYIFSLFSLNLYFQPTSTTEFCSNAMYVLLESHFLFITLSFFSAKCVCILKFNIFQF